MILFSWSTNNPTDNDNLYAGDVEETRPSTLTTLVQSSLWVDPLENMGRLLFQRRETTAEMTIAEYGAHIKVLDCKL